MKIVSINVEGSKHVASVEDFLVREKADVVCLMEAVEEDVINWKKLGYEHYVYAPNDLTLGERTGVAILSKQQINESEIFYAGEPIDDYLEGRMTTHCPVVVLGRIADITIGATHFSWTADGSADQRQREHLARLLAWVGTRDVLMCGDFNIPRGSELYGVLEQKWHDNIPVEITTTIDPHLHRVNLNAPGKLALVVDYVWSTPKYQVKNVQVEAGISDHCGVACEVV